MTDPTRESAFGRLWVLGTLLVLFVAPLWVMGAAGIMQVFPELVGYDVVFDQFEERRQFTMQSWLVAGSLSAAVVVGFLALVSLLGGGSWLASQVGHIRERAQSRRFSELAGDVVISGVEMKTTTVLEGATPTEAPTEAPREPSVPPVEAPPQSAPEDLVQLK